MGPTMRRGIHLMTPAAVRPGAFSLDPAPHQIRPAKDVFGISRLRCTVVGRIADPAARRLAHHPVSGRFVACLSSQYSFSTFWEYILSTNRPFEPASALRCFPDVKGLLVSRTSYYSAFGNTELAVVPFASVCSALNWLSKRRDELGCTSPDPY